MSQPQCTAMTRGSGGTERCKNRARYGTTVCRKHGAGLALRSQGPANPKWKHGRHSKLFKEARFRERYEEHVNDPELLAHRDEVALLDVLLDDEVAAIGVDAGTAERLWHRASDLMVDFEIALRNRDQAGQQAAFLRLRDVVRDGQRDAEARKEARRLVQERTTIAEREARRILSLKNVLTGEQAYTLFQGIMYEIHDTVTDPKIRTELHNRLMRLAGSVAADDDEEEIA